MVHAVYRILGPGGEVINVGPGRDLVRDFSGSLEPWGHDQREPVSGRRASRGQTTRWPLLRPLVRRSQFFGAGRMPGAWARDGVWNTWLFSDHAQYVQWHPVVTLGPVRGQPSQ
eukprot:15519346-Heterocapsa_arctica.AAC.1